MQSSPVESASPGHPSLRVGVRPERLLHSPAHEMDTDSSHAGRNRLAHPRRSLVVGRSRRCCHCTSRLAADPFEFVEGDTSQLMGTAVKIVGLLLVALVAAYLGLGVGLQVSPGLAYAVWLVGLLVVVYGSFRLFRKQ